MHASAVAELEDEAPPPAVHVAGFPAAGEPVEVAGYFERLKEEGAEYGPAFRDPGRWYAPATRSSARCTCRTHWPRTQTGCICILHCSMRASNWWVSAFPAIMTSPVMTNSGACGPGWVPRLCGRGHHGVVPHARDAKRGRHPGTQERPHPVR